MVQGIDGLVEVAALWRAWAGASPKQAESGRSESDG